MKIYNDLVFVFIWVLNSVTSVVLYALIVELIASIKRLRAMDQEERN